MTGDGRFVVFNSYSAILVPGDTNGTTPTTFSRGFGGTVCGRGDATRGETAQILHNVRGL